MEERRLPVRRVLEEAEQRTRRCAAGRLQLDREESTLRRGAETLDVHSERDDVVVTFEAVGGRACRLLGRGEQGVDPCSQAVAPGAPCRVTEPVDREERRSGQRVSRAEREVRKTRKSGLETVHDVEAAVCECEAEVGPHCHRDAHVRAPRDRDRRPDGDDVRVGSALQRPSTGEQITRPRRRGEHRDVMTEPPESCGRSVHVRVDLVRL